MFIKTLNQAQWHNKMCHTVTSLHKKACPWAKYTVLPSATEIQASMQHPGSLGKSLASRELVTDPTQTCS